MSAHHAWGGALTALGGLTLLGGVSDERQPINPATVLGAAGTGVGVWLLLEPDRKGRSRVRHPQGRGERRRIAERRARQRPRRR